MSVPDAGALLLAVLVGYWVGMWAWRPTKDKP